MAFIGIEHFLSAAWFRRIASLSLRTRRSWAWSSRSSKELFGAICVGEIQRSAIDVRLRHPWTWHL